MDHVPPLPEPRYLARLLTWRRIRVVALTTFVSSVLLLAPWTASYAQLLARLSIIGFVLLAVFTLLEAWPRQLPRWFARWALQVAGVAVAVPFAAAIAYWLTTLSDAQVWYQNAGRLGGYRMLTGFGVLVGPWVAISALLRQISGEAQRQALAFELARSEFERDAVNARLRLLQAQVEPHFLFNTLANVRELVDAGSPQASAVLSSLIAYLRAAVPRLDEPATTLRDEMALVRAYLEIMQMRMPDRLQFLLHVDDAALAATVPNMTVLTLVENAVRHGIDPSEDGGRIEVRVTAGNDHCRVQVIDTGVGLGAAAQGLGTGLSNLRERLRLAFKGDAMLRVLPLQPRGVCAEVDFPLRAAP